ncbi:YfhO family protein [Candidatus Daviesbacteria bacterium]|nr:YfhO family protein [Candidatus Daviesbacteria bacterium]
MEIHKFKKLFANYKALTVILVLFLLSFVYFFNGFFGDQIIWGFDTPKIVLPFIYLMDEAFKSLHLPLWTTDIYFGFPIGGDGQIPWFYPLSIIHIFLPLRLTVFILSFLHVFLAGMCTYLFARKINLNRFAALFAGVVFMFNGFIIAHMQYFSHIYAYAYLPLILLFIELAISRQKQQYFILAGASFGLQLLTGHPNIPIMTIIYVTLYLFLRSQSKIFNIVGIFIMLGIALMISLPYVLYSIGLILLSIRNQGVSFADATNSSFSFFDFITFFFPNFYFNSLQPWTASMTWHFWGYWGQIETTGYVGIITLFLASFAFLKETRKKAMLFFMLLLISLILALGKNTPLYKILLHIPIFDGLRAPGRFLFLVDFSLAILAGLGFTVLFQRRELKGIKINGTIILASFLIFIVVIVGFSFARFYPGQIYDFILQNYSKLGYVTDLGNPASMQRMVLYSFQEQTKIGLIFISLSALIIILICNGFRAFIIKMAIIIFVIADLFFFASKVNIWKNFNELINSEDSTINKLKNELTYSTGRVYTFSHDWTGLMPDQLIPHHIPEANGFASLPLKRFEKWQNEAERQWFAGKTDLFKIGSVRYLYFNNSLVIVDSPLPRVYITSQWSQAKNDSEAFSLVTAENFDPNTVILETKDTGEFNGIGNSTTIKPGIISTYKSDYVKIDYISSNDGILVLTDTNFPGWKAYLNGKEISIYQANYLFRAVKAPAGSNIIEFKYKPSYLNESIVLSIMSLVAVLFILSRNLLKRKYNEQN